MNASAGIAEVDDVVFVDCCDGFSGVATVTETRPDKYARCKVKMWDGHIGAGQEFWAHDFEVSGMSDSRIETYKHIQQVQAFVDLVLKNLMRRSLFHDQSKLCSPEVEAFDEFTPKLAGSTYGSDEYKELLAAMKPALDHHYANNSHHPEYYANGIAGMSLLDLTEMLCDWKAATMRHNNGDLAKSIEINQKRFGYTDELKSILVNTAKELGLFAIGRA